VRGFGHDKARPKEECEMLLFVGLGNPGASHAGHRHNVGFMAVDRIAAVHGFGPWRSKFRGALSEGRFNGDKVLLLKPMTFMNRSGQAVGEAMRFLKLGPSAVTVFHDELDLAPGKIKVKQGGGHAGHNGLRSIHEHIGPDHARVRIGIGHPGHKDRVAGYVLHDFAKADSEWLDTLLEAIAQAAGALVKGQAARFSSEVARQVTPPRPTSRPPGPASGVPDVSGPPEAESSEAVDPRPPLRRLFDRFR
jgi:peptidyl-tRNA hydrolase, PTH1 family